MRRRSLLSRLGRGWFWIACTGSAIASPACTPDATPVELEGAGSGSTTSPATGGSGDAPSGTASLDDTGDAGTTSLDDTSGPGGPLGTSGSPSDSGTDGDAGTDTGSSGATGECGDGEGCDTGLTCSDFGFLGGELACGPDCSVDTSACADFAVELSEVRRFDFSWPALPGADYYQIHQASTPAAPSTQLGDDIFGESIAHELPVHLSHGATYTLRACDVRGCEDAASLELTGSLVEAVGRLEADVPLVANVGRTMALSADGHTVVTGNAFQRVYVFIRTAFGQWEFETELTPSNLSFGDDVGSSVAVSADGNTLAFGSRGEDSAASGVGGDGSDNSSTGSGAAYVYARDPGGDWVEQAYIKASNPDEGDHFGASVSLSADGNTLVVGAPDESSAATGVGGDQFDDSVSDAGAAYVFVRDGNGQWTQQAYVKAPTPVNSNTRFAQTVSVDHSGDILIASAAGNDAVYEYARDESGTWSSQGLVVDAGFSFQSPARISGDGNTIALGLTGDDSSSTGIDGEMNNDAFLSGAVFIYVRDGAGGWAQQAFVKATNTDASDSFGAGVALSFDGNVLAVRGFNEAGNAVGINGDGSDNSVEDAGAAYVYTRDDLGTWSVRSYVKSPDPPGEQDYFGAVALDHDGTTLAVGARGVETGRVFLY